MPAVEPINKFKAGQQIFLIAFQKVFFDVTIFNLYNIIIGVLENLKYYYVSRYREWLAAPTLQILCTLVLGWTYNHNRCNYSHAISSETLNRRLPIARNRKVHMRVWSRRSILLPSHCYCSNVTLQPVPVWVFLVESLLWCLGSR